MKITFNPPANIKKKLYPIYTRNINSAICLNNKFSCDRVSFSGYYGDSQPLKKMFWHLCGRNEVYEDNYTNQHLYIVNNYKWVNANPTELLKRSPEQAIQSTLTIAKPSMQYPGIPSYIPSPNYGDKWGRYANYIEINPRLIAKYDKEEVSEGLLNTLKLLPAIPPTAGKGANCIILSQLYPTLGDDGKIYDSSLYCVNLHNGISKNLLSPGLYNKMGADEQVKAFNDCAHLLGFKTGIRMPLSAGQMRVKNLDFNWNLHEKAFIDACIWAIELGFDAIYFDSCKHIIDKNGYCGVGALPNEKQFAYILYTIRNQTGRNDLSFIGEKCDDSYIYKQMGLTAGTDWGKADNIHHVKHEANKQMYNFEYAAGPEVSNDNDYGEISLTQRINRINSCLWGLDINGAKLPTYMQLNDIFPFSNRTTTHDSMMYCKKLSGSEAWTDCERHWDGIFSDSPIANEYTQNVYHIFESAIRH